MESFIGKDIGLQPAASTINDSITYHCFPVNFTKLLSQLFCRMVAASGMTLFNAIELLTAFVFQNQYSFLQILNSINYCGKIFKLNSNISKFIIMLHLSVKAHDEDWLTKSSLHNK